MDGGFARKLPQHQTSWGNGIMKRERSVESYGKGKHFGWVGVGDTSRFPLISLTEPLKSYLPNRKVVFQPPFFRGYVKLPGALVIEEDFSERDCSEKKPGRCGRTLTNVCSFETSFDVSYDTVDGRRHAPPGMYKTLQCFALILDRIFATEPRIQSKGSMWNANPCHDKFR